jgi:hypothetical protein
VANQEDHLRELDAGLDELRRSLIDLPKRIATQRPAVSHANALGAAQKHLNLGSSGTCPAQIGPNEKFIVAEDVVTRGGRVQETVDIVRAHGGVVAGVGVIVDRSGGQRPDYSCPFVSLIEMNVETFPADQVPLDLADIPAVKPGSK